MKTLRDIVVTDHIYVDGNQDFPRGLDSFIITRLPCADYAWIREGKLYAIEEKRAKDLDNSLRSRRLQKQLRSMVEQTDVPLLGLRLEDLAFVSVFSFASPWLLTGLMGWLNWGGIVIIPEGGVPEFLITLRATLGSGAQGRAILKGTDHKRPEAATVFQRAVKRLFTGVGQITAERLDTYFKGNFMAALATPAVEWKQAGAHVGIIRQLEELQK